MASKAEMTAVLRQLYSAVASEDPTLRWNSTTDFCEWHGIKCNTQGLITHLELDYARRRSNAQISDISLRSLNTLRVLRLKGFHQPWILLDDLFYLTELKELSFEDSNIYTLNISPKWNTRLPSLEVLDLRTQLPQLFSDWIYCHPSLKTLRISLLRFMDSGERCTNSVLRNISIDFEMNAEIDYSRFTNLNDLTVKCIEPMSMTLQLPASLIILESKICQFSHISVAEGIALKELKLPNIGYRSRAEIDILLKPQLEVIDLSNNGIEGRLPDLTNFPQLRHFNLSGNQITDHISSYTFPKLTALDLSNNNLNGLIPDTICQSPVLEQLLLHSNSLTGPIPSCLGESQPNLRTVVMHNNRLTGNIPHSLLLHPELHTLNLASNNLEGQLPPTLPEHISILDLSYNKLTGQLTDFSFKNLSLIILNLNNNQFEGPIPEELFTMPKLQRLSLSANQMSGTIPSTLSKNIHLTYLSLAENKLNGPIPKMNCPCKELYLNNNQLSGSIIRDSGFNALEVLDVSTNKIEEISFSAPKLLEFYGSNNVMTYFDLNAPAVQILEMANNQLSECSILDLPSLIKVDFSANELATPLSIVSSMLPSLLYCNFSHNNLRDIRLNLDLAIWPIETIDLSHNELEFGFPFKDGFGKSLRQLRNLHLNDNRIWGHISGIDTTFVSRLTVLNLANNRMHGKINAELLEILGKNKLNVLVLSGNRGITIEKDELKSLMSHPTLTQLSLSYCSVPELSEDFSNLNELEVLELAGCGLSGEITTATIRKLRLLRRLDLSSNDFTVMPTAPQVWESLVGLEHIDLSGNLNLKGELSPEFSQSGLRYIDVSNTRLSGTLPTIRSSVIEVARFANCSFSGIVPQFFATSNQIREFDISNNELRYFHSSWMDFKCPVNSTNGNRNSSNGQSLEVMCNMRGNYFQCHAFPWKFDCCGASCSALEQMAYGISGSIAALIVLVATMVMAMYYGRRYLVMRRNKKSLEHLERSLLADAFENVEHDMMINWSDIKFITKIGEGAFGTVYKGQYKGTEVAVKALKVAFTMSSAEPTTANDEYRVTLNELVTEVRFLMKLKHPFIALLMGASIEKGRMAIVLEYMHHGSLYNLLHKSKITMDWTTKCRVAHQIACGMQYLHLQTPPVIHRDLKSMNILIDKNMTAKITDFGFSRENGATSMTSMVGTISYMAPEMFGQTEDSSSTSTLSTTARYDTTCDIYSYGILLWELLTEQIPWRNYSQPMLIASVLNGSRPLIPPLDACVVLHYSRMNTSQAPSTDLRDLEMIDNDSMSLLESDAINNNNASSISNLTADISRYIEVMKQCWAQNPRERPSFTTITKTLEALLPK